MTTGSQPISASLVFANLLMVAILIADAMAPLGTGISALYAIPLLIVSYAGPLRLAVYGAGAATLRTVSRPLAVPIADLTAAILINRAVALAVIWTTASIIVRLRQASTALDAGARDTGQFN